MYGLNTVGATTLFHLFAKHPVLVLALGLAGLGNYITNYPGPGDRYGTESTLADLERQLTERHPELSVKTIADIRTRFEAQNAEPTEDQVRRILDITDRATDVRPKDILALPSSRHDAAWLLYLDAYAREGPDGADRVFAKPKRPPRK